MWQDWKRLSGKLNNILHCPPCGASQPQRGCFDPPPTPLRRGCSSGWSNSCLVVSSRWASCLYWQPHLHEPAVCPTRPRAMVTWPVGMRNDVGFLLSSAGYTLQAVLNMPGWWAVCVWDGSQTLKTFCRSRRDIAMVQQKLGWILKEGYFVREMLQESIWLWTPCDIPFSTDYLPFHLWKE